MYACLYLVGSPDRAAPSRDDVLALAREFAPRVEMCGERGALLDTDGLGRLIGDARTIANVLRRAAADRGWAAHVAVAGTRTAARVLAVARAGVTIVPAGGEAAALAPLPLRVLESFDLESFGITPLTLRRWGLKTLGDLAALPGADLFERLGPRGLRWQQLARGEDERPLVPAAPEERFEASLELEWPIEGLEPLAFVLGRLLDDVCGRLARRDRGAVALDVRLRLVTRNIHARRLEFPVALSDPRVLRTLAVIDLESHPPPAAIDAVTVAADPAPGPIIHYSLFARAAPAPEQLATLLARLSELMGRGGGGAPPVRNDRCGAAALVDTHRPDGFEMKPFAIRNAEHGMRNRRPDQFRIPHSEFRISCIFRRFRPPRAVRVTCERGRPARVTIGDGTIAGRVETCAGPWRASGDWWRSPWRRETWDVALATGGVYRIFRDRETERWFVEGMVD